MGYPCSLSGTCWLAIVELLFLWPPGFCGVPSLQVRSPVSGTGCVLPQSTIVAWLSLLWLGLLLVFVRLLLPPADAVGFGLSWSAQLSDLLQGRCCSFTRGSSSLAWLCGDPSTLFLLLCLPLGCGHPLGSLVSLVTIDCQRRFPLEGFFFWVVASRLGVVP